MILSERFVPKCFGKRPTSLKLAISCRQKQTDRYHKPWRIYWQPACTQWKKWKIDLLSDRSIPSHNVIRLLEVRVGSGESSNLVVTSSFHLLFMPSTKIHTTHYFFTCSRQCKRGSLYIYPFHFPYSIYVHNFDNPVFLMHLVAILYS